MSAWIIFAAVLVVLVMLFLPALRHFRPLILTRTAVPADRFTAFKDVASSIQSFYAVLALLAGAGWATYTWIIQTKTAAEKEKAAIEINISARQTTASNTPPYTGYFIAGDITIKNTGTRSEMLQFNKGPLIVARVTSIPNFDEERSKTEPCKNARIEFDNSTTKRFLLSRPQVKDDLGLLEPRSDIELREPRPDIELGDEIRPGATDIFHFFVNVTKPGTYALMLSLDFPSKQSQGSEAEVYNPCDRTKKKYQNRWESPAIFVVVPADQGSTAEAPTSTPQQTKNGRRSISPHGGKNEH